VGWDNVGGHGGDSSAGLRTLLDTCWRTRAYGDFWSHMMVAEGAVDVAAEPDLKAWDVAALMPVVIEAGGRCTGYDGTSPLVSGCGLSTNGLLHDEVVGLLRPRP
jgi:histidinol-phosphatase